MPLLSYKQKLPNIDPSCFIAPNAYIIGDVTMCSHSSVWFNCTIRGDVHWIKIGQKTNIQDGSTLHVTKDQYPLLIHDNVTVGHGAILHGCTVHNTCLLGMGCIILDQAVVEEESIVAAGALVKEGFIVPRRHLVAGVPAKVIRALSETEIEKLHQSAQHYVEYSRAYHQANESD